MVMNVANNKFRTKTDVIVVVLELNTYFVTIDDAKSSHPSPPNLLYSTDHLPS